ncbi:protein-glutamine gamma-glutamyltransferase 2-like isoform X1 [Cynoglossus semilaevis]|uniref:protein-glutamine gamma-glutamyltransferase 2-like isoform X1 n=1 Tax=Cynoglossus semilaevis TaxID=244447 RepID=UPI000494F867|nr:protein-glutamine gamma-glutamyltransferase 2-like isoform X1 [Cynoglossus semilaevis]
MRKVLDIQRCDLNIENNNRSHHTELNGVERLIVRRGQTFTIILYLKPDSPEFRIGRTKLTLIAETGPSPRRQSDTKVSFSVGDSTVDTEWSASAITDPSGNTVSVCINSSPDSPIGLYSLTLTQGKQETNLGQFVLLFNAWCSNDAVYMRNEKKRQEYVLAQTGQVYRGTHKRIRGKPWNFAQFEPGILDICLKILDENPKFLSNADKDCSERKNPVYVTRVLSAMINSNDDNGVLVGNWGEISDDGVHPGEWIGSEDILRQWAESGPVRYGQCWVFAAVACTVSRALGIPCRVVTNFGSAHDVDANLLIEFVFNTDGELISDDSIWNFHVWVESWMTRPDLGIKYDGWQISDPTPQETSNGVFCCGPASLTATKEGELTTVYDTPFVFAEVNADVVTKLQLSTGKILTVRESTSSVGRSISTKAVGSDERRDITHKYKYPEGSKKERQVYEKAQHHNKLQQRGEKPGLNLKIKLIDNMVMGSDFDVYALLKNNSMESKTCNVKIFAKAVQYNGKRGKPCGYASGKLEVPPGEERRLPLRLMYDTYGPVITSDLMIQVSSITFDESSNYHRAEKTIVLDEPEVEIKLMGRARVNKPVTAELRIKNTLPEPLKNCSFTVGGRRLACRRSSSVIVGDVGANKEAKGRVVFRPTIAGPTVLTVKFNSNKLRNIKGSVKVDVTY